MEWYRNDKAAVADALRVVLQKCWWYAKLGFISRRAEEFSS